MSFSIEALKVRSDISRLFCSHSSATYYDGSMTSISHFVLCTAFGVSRDNEIYFLMLHCW